MAIQVIYVNPSVANDWLTRSSMLPAQESAKTYDVVTFYKKNRKVLPKTPSCCSLSNSIVSRPAPTQPLPILFVPTLGFHHTEI